MNIIQGLLSRVSLCLGKAMQTFPLQRIHFHKSCIIYRGDSCQLSVSNFNFMERNLGSEIHCSDFGVGFTLKPSYIYFYKILFHLIKFQFDIINIPSTYFFFKMGTPKRLT